MRLSCGAWEIALLHPADARVAGGRLLLVLHLLTMVAGLVTLLRELAPTPEGNTLAAVVARASVTGGRL